MNQKRVSFDPKIEDDHVVKPRPLPVRQRSMPQMSWEKTRHPNEARFCVGKLLPKYNIWDENDYITFIKYIGEAKKQNEDREQAIKTIVRKARKAYREQHMSDVVVEIKQNRRKKRKKRKKTKIPPEIAKDIQQQAILEVAPEIDIENAVAEWLTDWISLQRSDYKKGDYELDKTILFLCQKLSFVPYERLSGGELETLQEYIHQHNLKRQRKLKN